MQKKFYPLMSQFMANDNCNPLFSYCGTILRIIQQCGLTIGNQTPVLKLEKNANFTQVIRMSNKRISSHLPP